MVALLACAILIFTSALAVAWNIPTHMITGAIAYRILQAEGSPAIYSRLRWVANGGLMSYGPDEIEPYQRTATMVDKILKGAKTADLPVEQPTKFELVINLKAAKQVGLTIPPNVLARADKVIK